jgi:UDP-glucose 6-dehydrogenase
METFIHSKFTEAIKKKLQLISGKAIAVSEKELKTHVDDLNHNQVQKLLELAREIECPLSISRSGTGMKVSFKTTNHKFLIEN